MRGMAWASGALLALVFALGASAEAQMRHGGRGGFHLLARADADSDGRVTREEARNARASAFTRLDSNTDGFLTEADHADRMAKRAEKRAERHKAMHEAMDADHDGKVSRAEFLAAPMQGFDRMDANSDGVIDADEMAAARAAWRERRGRSAPAPAPGQTK